ncbi:hypothetical protein HZC33_02770 [Candidatus Wolfebacteria bacterium]|nr:hypothetical protein [Candidatus Wolfebacteria bacterium]
MNVKILALGLTLVAGIISLNLVFLKDQWKNQENVGKFKVGYQQNNIILQKNILADNPIDWVGNLVKPIEKFIAKEQIVQPLIIKEQPIVENNSIKPQSNEDVLPANRLFKTIIGDNNSNNNQELAVDYYKNFLEISRQISFEKNSIEKMVEDPQMSNAPMTLENLIEIAASGTNLEELRFSFGEWERLDYKMVNELNKLNNQFYFNKELANWFKYNADLAGKFSKNNLNKNEIESLASEFKAKGAIHNENFKKSVAVLEKSPKFSLIQTAQAFTCAAFSLPGFYNFGGRVSVQDACDHGVVEIILPPCGGSLMFSYPVLAANPYLYKKPIISSVVLGKALVAPWVAACLPAEPIPYEAEVLFFGTSGLP